MKIVVAQRHDFEVHGSIGILLWAAATGRLVREEAESALEALSRSTLWISSRVLEEAHNALEQIFAGPD